MKRFALASVLALAIAACASEPPPRPASPRPTRAGATAAPVTTRAPIEPVGEDPPLPRIVLRAGSRPQRAPDEPAHVTLAPRHDAPPPATRTAPPIAFLAEADVAAVISLFPAAGANDAQAAGYVLALANRHRELRQPREALGCYRWAQELAPERTSELEPTRRQLAAMAAFAALARDESDVAARLLETVPATCVEGRYMAGELELAKGGDAASAFHELLEGLGLDGRPASLLRDLARRRAAGETLDPETPGIAARWKVQETAHFLVLRDGDEAVSLDELEAARREVLARLGTDEAVAALAGRITVRVVTDPAVYARTDPQHPWAWGCTSDDGIGWTVTLRSTAPPHGPLRHELAHVFAKLMRRSDDLPPWAVEGVAVYGENDEFRQKRYRALARSLASGLSLDVAAFVGVQGYPPGDAVEVFYAESGAVFEQLVGRAPSVSEALDVAARIAREARGPDGPDVAGLSADLAGIEDEVARVIARAAEAAPTVASQAPVAPEPSSVTLPPEAHESGLKLVAFAMGGLAVAIALGAAAVALRNAVRNARAAAEIPEPPASVEPPTLEAVAREPSPESGEPLA